jgi:structure-specific recognition protein 1
MPSKITAPKTVSVEEFDALKQMVLDLSKKFDKVILSKSSDSPKLSKADEKAAKAALKAAKAALPKKPITSFMLYSIDNRADFVVNNPDVVAKDIARLLGKAWKSLSCNDRKVYEDQYIASKAAYDSENPQPVKTPVVKPAKVPAEKPVKPAKPAKVPAAKPVKAPEPEPESEEEEEEDEDEDEDEDE